jgi:hypothetical protein
MKKEERAIITIDLLNYFWIGFGYNKLEGAGGRILSIFLPFLMIEIDFKKKKDSFNYIEFTNRSF